MTHLKRLLGFKSRIGFLSDMIAVVLAEGLAPARGAGGEGVVRYRMGRNDTDHRCFQLLAKQSDRLVKMLNVSD
jgi:hypothetical protein